MDKFLGSPKTLYTSPRGGYITLISVLVVGAIGTAVTVSLLLLGLGTSRTSFAHEESAEARALSGACAEETLEHIRDAALCDGGETLTMGHGSCTVVVTTAGDSCLIEAQGTVGRVVRRLRVELDSVSPVTVASWREVPNFE